ncbi:MAG: DUF1501 domain-containing protein [Pseudomonadota bacterium]
MTDALTLSRRRFLSALGVGAAALPSLGLPGFVQAAGQPPGSGGILVLVELAGGNDGLNTVVPVTDPAYRGLRPEIGLARDETLRLDADTGLHPEMRAMADLWERGELGIVEGVGYPNPNRSHFRSIEIWNAGQGAASVDRQGWISTAFDDGRRTASGDADGVVLGGDMGPLSGAGRFTAMRDEEMFLETLENLPGGGHAVRPAGSRSPLDHVLATYESAGVTGDRIRTRLEQSRRPRWTFPESDIAQQLQSVARLLDAGVEVPVLKVVQDGYDTHQGQPDQHSWLLGDLSAAIGAFASVMQAAGLWDRITVVTYSEFGRTARENASGGTDHGTAAPVFVAGGAVRGGFAGARPDLGRLVEDDLVYTTDYRQLYSAILSDLWDLTPPAELVGPGPALRLLG